MKYILISLVKLYQKILSPDHSWLKHRYPYGFCRFYPSCSDYAIQAIKAYGSLKGTALTIKRIIKCNPFVKPQIDKP